MVYKQTIAYPTFCQTIVKKFNPHKSSASGLTNVIIRFQG